MCKKSCKECPWVVRNKHNDMIVGFSQRMDKPHNCHMVNGGKELWNIKYLGIIKSNLFILRIGDEEAYKLDIELGLRTTMPEGWNFGQDVYSRITFAGIQLEAPKG